jgi:hypothetical protein
VADSAGAEADGGGSRKVDGRWRLIVVEGKATLSRLSVGQVDEGP